MEIRHITILEELKEKGHVVYTGSGVSMLPLLRQKRDFMIIESRAKYEAGGRVIGAGDAVLFTRGEKLVLHRILEVQSDAYIICGDNQFTPELVEESRVIGVMTGFVRDGAVTRTDDPEYQKYVKKIMNRSMKKRKFITYARVVKRKLRQIYERSM